ncbi:MAG: RNA polymerase sigma-70 factor [Tannerellaceae bacterium]
MLSSIFKSTSPPFEVIFREYYPMLYSYALQYIVPQDAEEVVQDVMIWYWENHKELNIDLSLKAYLFKAVRNRCLSQIDKLQRQNNVIESFRLELRELFEDPDFYVVEELVKRIDTAINNLPPTYREAFEMHRFQHMTYAEIAQKLNVSSKTVDYRIQQSLKLLKLELYDYLPLIAMLFKVNDYQA